MHPLQIVFILICLTLLAYGVLWCAEQVGRRVRQRQVFRPVRTSPATLTERRAPVVSPVSSSTNTDIHAAQSTPPDLHLTERAGVIWLAGKKKVDGSWALSANAIYDLVRGNRNEVMGWIREVRAEAADEPQAEIVTPYAGRRTKAVYYPDDPDLEFRAPPQEANAV